MIEIRTAGADDLRASLDLIHAAFGERTHEDDYEIEEQRMPNFEAYVQRVKVEEAPKPPSQPVFGRQTRRYRNRL